MTEIATHSKRTLHCPRNGNIMPNISFVLAGKQQLFCKMTDTSSNKSGDTFFYFQIWAHPKAGENRKLKESLSWQKLNSAVVEILLEFSESQVCAQKSCSPKQYLCHPKVIFLLISQEHLGAPIYWSPKILFSIFWGGMKRESSDKTRFCVSLEGLPNGLGTFSSPWFMFENKTKNMFLTRRGSNILEPGRQYIGAP